MTQAETYTTQVTIAAPPKQVQAAISDVRGWWSQEVEGDTDHVGAEFVFHGHDDAATVEHRSVIRVEQIVPGELVAWRVLDNTMSFVADQEEWRGTEIRFELSPDPSGTLLRFAHVGLVPAYECYDACSSAWGFFIGTSLKDFVETGAGRPITPLEQPA